MVQVGQVGQDPVLWLSGSTEAEVGQIPGPSAMALISHNKAQRRQEVAGG